MNCQTRFKQRLTAREPLVGCFIKTPHPIVIEVLGQSALDFLVLDAEHAPFDRQSIDTCIIAGRAVDCPILVRVPNEDWILNVLDSGAAGILVPHVTSVEQAQALTRLVHYGPNGRGFAGTTRAAHYAQRPLAEHRHSTQHEVSLICQIEDPAGVEQAAAIAAVPGVDALFVGRADLAVAYELDDFFDASLAKRCADILGVKEAATGLFCTLGEDRSRWAEAGASLFVVGSEHALMMSGVQGVLD